MYRIETQTLQQAPLKQKKGLAHEGPIGPGGEDVCSVRYGSGRGGLSLARPRPYTEPGGVFFG